VVSIAFIIPITLLLAFRFLLASPPGSLPGFGEALRLVLVATAFNMVLPSKAGDLVKSFFVARGGKVSAGVAVSIIVYERFSDLFGLTTCCLLGWILARNSAAIPLAGWIFVAAVWLACLVLLASQRSANWLLAIVHILLPHRRLARLRNLAAGWPDLHAALRGRRRYVVLVSVLAWVGYMVQMWMFTLAISVQVPFETGLGIFALAVLAGQLPLTLAGFGTRDVALVVMLSHYMTPESAAAIALLSGTRGILPALAALPIAHPYLAVVVGDAARWRQRNFARRDAKST